MHDQQNIKFEYYYFIIIYRNSNTDSGSKSQKTTAIMIDTVGFMTLSESQMFVNQHT